MKQTVASDALKLTISKNYHVVHFYGNGNAFVAFSDARRIWNILSNPLGRQFMHNYFYGRPSQQH